MANEIQLFSVTGLSPTVQFYSGSTPVGPPVSLTEITGTGAYYGDMPAGIPYGQYIAIAFAAPNVVIASGQMFWDGNFEFPVGLVMLQGLDPNNTMKVTPSSRTAGPINLQITGDGSTNTEVQRL